MSDEPLFRPPGAVVSAETVYVDSLTLTKLTKIEVAYRWIELHATTQVTPSIRRIMVGAQVTHATAQRARARWEHQKDSVSGDTDFTPDRLCKANLSA